MTLRPDSDSTRDRAVSLWREDERGALEGSHRASAEAGGTDSWDRAEGGKRSQLMRSLAEEQPERFLELCERLPHALQDVFYQFYLLNRSQDQIAEVLGVSQSQIHIWVEVGVEGLCAVIAGAEDVPGPLKDAYERMLKVKVPDSMERVVKRVGLGELVVRIEEGELENKFQLKRVLRP